MNESASRATLKVLARFACTFVPSRRELQRAGFSSASEAGKNASQRSGIFAILIIAQRSG